MKQKIQIIFMGLKETNHFRRLIAVPSADALKGFIKIR